MTYPVINRALPHNLRFRSCLGLEGVWKSSHVVRKRAVLGQELNVAAVDTELASLALLNVLGAVERRETPLLGDDDLLATWELVLRATEGLDGGGAVCRCMSV